MPDMITGKSAKRAAEAQSRKQLKDLAAQKAEVDQQGASGGRRKAGALLNFAQNASLSGTGQDTFG